MDVHRAFGDVAVEPVELGEQLTAGEDPLGLLRHGGEDPELARGALHRPVVDPHLMAYGIHREGLLGGLAQGCAQVPSVGDLEGLRGAVGGVFGVAGGAVVVDDLDLGPLRQPG